MGACRDGLGHLTPQVGCDTSLGVDQALHVGREVALVLLLKILVRPVHTCHQAPTSSGAQRHGSMSTESPAVGSQLLRVVHRSSEPQAAFSSRLCGVQQPSRVFTSTSPAWIGSAAKVPKPWIGEWPITPRASTQMLNASASAGSHAPRRESGSDGVLH